MSNKTQMAAEKLIPIFQATDEALNEWVGEGNLQFPVLLGMIAVKLNWNDKQVREYDPFVRYYVRNNAEWYVTRGAHGGIMRVSDKQKKEADRLAKVAAKEQVKAAIEAKAAAEAASKTDATPADSTVA